MGTHYPAHTSSKPHTLPTSRILHPLLVYLPLFSNQSILFQRHQSLTKHHLHLFPPASTTLDLLHCHTSYCIACPQHLLPIIICADSASCMHYVLLSTTLLLHTPYLSLLEAPTPSFLYLPHAYLLYTSLFCLFCYLFLTKHHFVAA